ncbi:uncharacterized protein LOC121387383 isoform X2 [Gigantopelta aegis]|uniref:uncharacterized protein LOC121387383 isoform X2 n=1 Tax=Gigantopelta aegis TaxID=1735272 RepID=UPI001B88A8C8|nr:uncharacterized protein LOC121387383 isoform X2 [Gigantopelta aegis]
MALFFLFFSFWVIHCVTANPCNSFETFHDTCSRLVLNEWRESLEVPLNDAYLPVYNYYGTPGYMLANRPPSWKHCGTRFPMWVKDLPASGATGTSQVLTACVVSPGSNCYYSYKVRVIFCRDLQIYKLERPTIDAAYCLNVTKNQQADFSCTCKKLDGIITCKNRFFNYCANNVCQNGATCVNGYSTYSCKCPRGYTGKYCQKDPCMDYSSFSNICKRLVQNQLRSVAIPLSDSMISPWKYFGSAGYRLTGKPPALGHCGTRHPVWVRDLPASGFIGQSSDYVACVVMGQYKCYRTLNVTVHFCRGIQIYKLDQTEASSAYCLDVVDKDIDSCVCVEKSDGMHCRDFEDSCISNPCFNGGTCIADMARYTCRCPAHYFGKRCERKIAVYPCLSNPCQNGGTCSVSGDSFTCQCTSENVGNRCQYKKGPCSNYVSFSNVCKRLARSKYRLSEVAISDHNIPLEYFGAVGYKLLGSSPLSTDRCGTLYPVWIEDLPEQGASGQSIDVTACVVGQTGDCTMTMKVTVHFCPELQVYQLESTLDDSAYCLAPDNNACLNSSTCTGNVITCRCLEEDEGQIHCNDIVNFCANHQCKNYAACVNAVETYVCKCTEGYYGEYCENEETSYSSILGAILAICLILLVITVCLIFGLIELIEINSKKQHARTQDVGAQSDQPFLIEKGQSTRWRIINQIFKLHVNRLSNLGQQAKDWFTNLFDEQVSKKDGYSSEKSEITYHAGATDGSDAEDNDDDDGDDDNDDDDEGDDDNSDDDDNNDQESSESESLESAINVSSEDSVKEAAKKARMQEWGVYRNLMGGVAKIKRTGSDLTPYKCDHLRVPMPIEYRQLMGESPESLSCFRSTKPQADLNALHGDGDLQGIDAFKTDVVTIDALKTDAVTTDSLKSDGVTKDSLKTDGITDASPKSKADDTVPLVKHVKKRQKYPWCPSCGSKTHSSSECTVVSQTLAVPDASPTLADPDASPEPNIHSQVTDSVNYTAMAVAVPRRRDGDEFPIGTTEMVKEPGLQFSYSIPMAGWSDEMLPKGRTDNSIPVNRGEGNYQSLSVTSIGNGEQSNVPRYLSHEPRSVSESVLQAAAVGFAPSDNSLVPQPKKHENVPFTSWCAWCGSTKHLSANCSFNESLKVDTLSKENVQKVDMKDELAARSPSAPEVLTITSLTAFPEDNLESANSKSCPNYGPVENELGQMQGQNPLEGPFTEVSSVERPVFQSFSDTALVQTGEIADDEREDALPRPTQGNTNELIPIHQRSKKKNQKSPWCPWCGCSGHSSSGCSSNGSVPRFEPQTVQETQQANMDVQETPQNDEKYPTNT